MELKADNKMVGFAVNYKKPILVALAAIVLITLAIVALQIRDQRMAEEQEKAYQSGSQAYSKGKFDQAIKDLEAAKSLDPKDAKTHSNLAQSYEAKGQLDKALAEYKAALEINPNQIETRYNLAIIYKSQGRLDDATKELDKTLKLNKNFVAAQIALGDIYAQKGDYDNAREQYRAVLKARPFGIDLEAIREKLKSLN